MVPQKVNIYDDNPYKIYCRRRERRARCRTLKKQFLITTCYEKTCGTDEGKLVGKLVGQVVGVEVGDNVAH